MSDSSEVEKSLRIVNDLLYQVNGILPNDIDPNYSLIKDLGMDSVEIIDFLVRLEEYGVVINDSKISDRLTVGYIARLVNRRRSS
ncbi:acyl carrier protein [Erwinia piriflorinigrans]|uniref:Carrier domain-containing protein n=1 Tax=Erwinia piriflorinigrans CFBP 5888 TaxID=1161919 RepID=V5Z4J3_9GAMM|nr:acyl carrier protein [Erwinia piriflorinigrans]CCG86241.1 hypothetical protein EPIR_0876 [Erwinia piriflorinigrans CFBP 5888]